MKQKSLFQKFYFCRINGFTYGPVYTFLLFYNVGCVLQVVFGCDVMPERGHWKTGEVPRKRF